MSAPNFNCCPNTKKIYAFCMSEDYDRYCEDDREQMADDPDYDGPICAEFWYDDEKDYYMQWLHEELQTTFGDRVGTFHGEAMDGCAITTIRVPFTFAGTEWPVEVALRLHAGYYDGFTIDWDLTKALNYYSDIFPDEQDCIDELTADTWHYDRCIPSNINAGLAKILAPKMIKRLQAALDDTTDKIDAVLDKIAPHKWHGHCMSNGEGIYWPA